MRDFISVMTSETTKDGAPRFSVREGLPTIHPDATTTGLVSLVDQSLNSTLAPLLSTFFSDFQAASIGKGIYHPVATAAQDMVSNDKNAVLSPNGLGDLAEVGRERC